MIYTVFRTATVLKLTNLQPHAYNLTRAAYSVNELLDLLPLGRTSLYAAIKGGLLKATKFGKKTMFLAPDIVIFLESL